MSLPSTSLTELLALAERAARVGGALARQAFGAAGGLRLKADRSEVTDVDEAAERAVAQVIASARPGDALIGEEGVSGLPRPVGGGKGVCWAVDPIDGTRNFVRGLPAIACSVGALHQGVPVAGAIFDPLHGVMYSAHVGGGLRINGAAHAGRAEGRMPPGMRRVAAIPSLPGAEFVPAVHAMLGRYVVRTFGSAALHLAWIAAGHIDVALQDNPKLWDVAAGWLLVREAGLSVTRLDGGPLFPIDLASYRGQDMPLLAGSEQELVPLRVELGF